jgi:alkylation response protein AidB-like acyl-CoA dehydrogenase
MPVIEMIDGAPKVDPTTGQPVAPLAAIFPRLAATIPDTWHTLGMRGTGSADISVKDLFVPDHLTAPVVPLKNPAPGFEGPLFRMWPWTAVLGEATVSVGVAAAALDAGVELCKSKTAAFNARPLREQQLPQFQIGKARSLVEASRDTLYRAADAAYDQVASGGGLLLNEPKIRLQLAVAFAAETTAEAVRLVNTATGTSSIRLGQPFERHFRDVHVLLQHTSKNNARFASAGRMMFGFEPDPNLFWLNL